MNTLTGKDVKKIADLARMSLSEEEASSAAKNLSGILEHFETIRLVDTKDVPPADDVSGRKNITREDTVKEGILGSPEVLLANAKTKDGYIQVPGVFSEEVL